ncbi:MAG: 7,8-didemethyl-8-hydroxy-5-deazariboflavin synthase subunit CofH [Candidatus Hecatellales archaeon]|nr:MAG: 7,8-didemethyl-8-hydroxy-5-deazariboflavin synthase subunit CofH [Candidatus Hecatellales archaeon]
METFKEEFFKALDPIVAKILDKALDGKEVSRGEALELFKTKNLDFQALILVADWLRRKKVGDIVTYVCNRNINFTNVCYNDCGFCAFSKKIGDPEAYLLKPEEVGLKAKEAWLMGATEVCVQGGLHPKIDAYYYEEIVKSIKAYTPKIHIHGFSPMEIVYGSRKAGLTVKETLKMLKEAGLGSIPGTSAEILVDEVRREICPKKITCKEWVETVKTAHRLGIPSTSTIMYGHIDKPEDWAVHLSMLKEIQRETHGFTEFVPLTFVHWNTPIYLEGKSKPGATGFEDLKMYAVSRIFFNGLIDNIQVSWVKLGVKFAQVALNAGANDFGGTLMEENISRAAGATTGQNLPVEEIVRVIKDAGRIPAERTTTYQIIKAYG